MAKTICLSAGHQLHVDNGATYKELTEASLTIRIAMRAAEIIRKHGVGCLYVPDNLSLIQTIDWINQRASQITICVDVHINSGGSTGIEAWNYAGGPNASDTLSKHLVEATVAETGLRSRGIKDELTNRHGRLGFVHDTKPVAALIECGFIDGDYAFLKSAAGIEKLARGVARGCLTNIGVAWNPQLLNTAPAPAPAPSVNWEAIAKEAAKPVFGYIVEGTPTERLKKAQDIYKKHGYRP